MKTRVYLVGVLLSCVGSAATVTIAPGNGNATNVVGRITGVTDVEVNPGASGGGIVTLGRFNDYVGTTSNGCGTLVATALAPEGRNSSVGSSGPLMLAAGTFRYTGPSGAVMGHSVTNAFGEGETNKAVVVDAVSDFAIDGQWVQSLGAVVKKGAGTLTILGGPEGTTNFFGVTSSKYFNGFSSSQLTAETVFPANGDAPTAGYSGLTVAEGTLRLAGGVNLFAQNYGTSLGACYDYGDAVPTIELAGGTNIFYSCFLLGNTHAGDRAVLRVTGGDNYLAVPYTDNDRKKVRFGCVNGATGVLEMTGGTLTIPDSGLNLSLSAVNGAHGTILLSGGTFTVNRSVILGYAATKSGTLSGDLEVSGTGFLDVMNNLQTYNVNADMQFNVVVRDGGKIRTERFYHNGGRTSYSRPRGFLLVDGGIISGRESQHIFGNPAANGGEHFAEEVMVGSKGMVLEVASSQTLTLAVPMRATNTVDGLSPVGLTLRRATSGNVAFLFTTNNFYAGPTRVQESAQLRLSTGDLPAASEVVLEKGARLYLSNHARTVKSLTFEGACSVLMTTNAPLTVTDAFRAEGCSISLHTGDSWSSSLSEPGVYTLLTVPVADAGELRTFAKSFSAATGCTCRGWVETSATTAVLKVQVCGAEDAHVLDLGDGDVYDVSPQAFDLCTKTGEGWTLNLTTGAVLRATHLQATKSKDASIHVFFDGGTFQPVFLDDYSYLRYVSEWIVGAGGVTFDLSHCCDDPANARYYLNVKGVFRHDPNLGELPDGGFVVKGGPFMLGGDFVCAFNGPIRVMDGARFAATWGGEDELCRLNNCRLEVLPSASLEPYSTSKSIQGLDLMLGDDGATSPTFLAFMNNSPQPAFAFTNSCRVLSPVQVSVWASGSYFPGVTRAKPSGTYTVLAFASANSSVDPALFALNAADHPDVAATFAVVDFASDDFPTCDKVLVMTCEDRAAVSPTWTATASGGTWNTLQNWANTETPPNGERDSALFAPATVAAVPVSLPADGVALRSLTLDGEATKGYSLAGGTLSLVSYRLDTPALTATSGTHSVANLWVDDTVALKTATNGPNVISSLEVASLTGSGSVSANTHVSRHAGTVKLGTSGFTGSLTTGSGCVEVDDLSFATTAARLKTGASTFRYTGPNATFGGFQLNGDRATYFETDADLLALAPVATKGALEKAGSGTLVLGGTGSFSPTAGSGDNSSDRLMHPNGDVPAGNYYSVTVCEGTLAIGVPGDPAHAPTVNAGNDSRPIAIGTVHTPADATSACLRLDNGRLTGKSLSMSFYLGNSPLTDRLTVRYEQNGGEAAIEGLLRTGYSQNSKKIRYELVVNDGRLDLGSVSLNYSNPSAANVVTNVFTVNGGVVNVGDSFEGNTAATRAAPSFVTLNGGRLSVAGAFDFTKNAAAKTVLDLNVGAVFEAGAVKQTAAGGTFNLNGGTFAPLGTESAVLTGLMAVNVSTNGAVVDTSKVQGGTYTISQTLAHDARLGDAPDGGLVKKGAGTLVLSVANAFTGPTRVEEGVLQLAADGAVPGAVAVAYDGVLDLGGATRSVPTLVRAPGVIRNGTLSLTNVVAVTGDCAGDADAPIIHADLLVANTATLDLGLADEAAGPSSSTVIPLAYVIGEATLPATVKAVHAGKVKRFELKLQDGLLLARPVSGGTLVVVR